MPGSLKHRFIAAVVFTWCATAALFGDAPGSGGDSPFFKLRNRSPGEGDTIQGALPTAPTNILICWFAPTNELATGGQQGVPDLWWAANHALAKANLQRGTNLPIAFIPVWSENPWKAGAAELFKQIYLRQPTAIIGSVDSVATHLAEQVVAKAHLPLVSPFTTDKSINLAGVPWMFSCAPSDDAIAPWIAGAAVVKTTNANLVLFSGVDHASRLETREVRKQLARLHGTLDQHLELAAGATNFNQQLQTLRSIAGDSRQNNLEKRMVFIVLAEPRQGADLVRCLKREYPQCTIVGSPRLGRFTFVQWAGDAAEGVLVPLLFNPTMPEKGVDSFKNQFSEQFHRDPDYAALLVYDATRLLAEAIRRAGPDRARLKEELARMKWRGEAGPITWDPTGQNSRAIEGMGVIRSGKLQQAAPP